MDFSIFNELNKLLDEADEFHKSLMEEFPELYSNDDEEKSDDATEFPGEYNTATVINPEPVFFDDKNATDFQKEDTYGQEDLQAYLLLKKNEEIVNEEWERAWDQIAVSPVHPSSFLENPSGDDLYLEVSGRLASGSQTDIAEAMNLLNHISSFSDDANFVDFFFSLAERPKQFLSENHAGVQFSSSSLRPEDRIGRTAQLANIEALKIFTTMDMLQDGKRAINKQELLKQAIQSIRR